MAVSPARGPFSVVWKRDLQSVLFVLTQSCGNDMGSTEAVTLGSPRMVSRVCTRPVSEPLMRTLGGGEGSGVVQRRRRKPEEPRAAGRPSLLLPPVFFEPPCIEPAPGRPRGTPRVGPGLGPLNPPPSSSGKEPRCPCSDSCLQTRCELPLSRTPQRNVGLN